MPTLSELAELRLADAIDALYAVRADLEQNPHPIIRPEFDSRRLALAITKAEESALWLGAARARGTIPEALRER